MNKKDYIAKFGEQRYIESIKRHLERYHNKPVVSLKERERQYKKDKVRIDKIKCLWQKKEVLGI